MMRGNPFSAPQMDSRAGFPTALCGLPPHLLGASSKLDNGARSELTGVVEISSVNCFPILKHR